MDGAHDRGISVVLGTPTYAVPMWLARKHPEIAAERSDGHQIPWGSRQEVDFTQPAFRFHAERVIRAIVGRYAAHPAVIGYQVDNEPGLHLLHNPSVFHAFVADLRHTYGDVATLNDAWGLAYWSHRLSTWEDLWTPHGNAQPQYDLAWRRFQARLTTEFISWQADIVRSLARQDQFVTTCLAYSRPALDEWELPQRVDVTAGNPYYGMQDALAVPTPEAPPTQGWTTSGTWALFHSADRMYASRQEPFLVTETNAGPIGGSAMNFPGWDGQWRQVAWAMIARGARMIEYWHWHSLHAGTETYWGGILPHDQQPGRVYEQLAQLGAELAAAGPAVTGLRPDADLGLLYSVPSKWGLAFQPPTAPDDTRHDPVDEGAYDRLTGVHARAAFEAGLRVRVVHDRQLLPSKTGAGVDPQRAAGELPVLVAPALYVARDELLDWLVAYAEAGGHLVLGVRTGYADTLARARLETKPGRLAAAAGVWYQEFSNVLEPVRLLPGENDRSGGEGGLPPLTLPTGATATAWVDALIPEGATVLARYDHPQFGRWPAVVSTAHGHGRITTIGTVPDPAAAGAVLDWAVNLSGGPSTRGRRTPAHRRWNGPASVTVASATAPDGSRIHVIHNWSWTPATATVPIGAEDLLGDAVFAAGSSLELGSWDVRVLKEA
jgi:beta-galactosidase